MVFISRKIMPDGTVVETRRYGSWKEISDALALSRSTLRRLEKEYGLPVHHLPGKRGRVYAFGDELEEWMRKDGGVKKSPDRPA